MLNRRGFTLIELLISIILLGIVGIATVRAMQAMMNAATAQVEIASSQGNARTAVLAMPQELREVGYDTIPYPGGGVVSDLESIATRRLTFHAMRGVGITCGTPTLAEFRIRKPVLGYREPQLTDRFLLFLENDPNAGFDDQWVNMLVLSIDRNSTCGADPAIAFTLAATPIVDPGLGNQPMALTQHRIGGPIRWYERLEYGPFVDATTNEAYVGVRSLSLGEINLVPVIGPLNDTTSFTFTYYGVNGSVLNPAVAPSTSVRAIGISLTTGSTRPVSLAGTTKRARKLQPIFTFVALRNALRP